MRQTWKEGLVNRDDEHVVISYAEPGEPGTPVALLAPGPGRDYTVQFILQPDAEDRQGQAMVDEVRGQLEFHLVELDEPDPWAYPRYHCYTASNAFGPVRWTLQKNTGGVATNSVRL